MRSLNTFLIVSGLGCQEHDIVGRNTSAAFNENRQCLEVALWSVGDGFGKGMKCEALQDRYLRVCVELI